MGGLSSGLLFKNDSTDIAVWRRCTLLMTVLYYPKGAQWVLYLIVVFNRTKWICAL